MVFGLVISFVILGLTEQMIASNDLRSIRLEQIYGLTSLFLLIFILLVSPIYKLFPKLPYKSSLQYNMRPLGVLVFYYGLLHTLISFFGQLDGFSGLGYLNHTYGISLLAGTFGLMILLAMTITSLDWAVTKLGFDKWKRLQKLIYLVLALVLLHVFLIGTHFVSDKNFIFYLTIFLVGLFVLFKHVIPKIKK